MSRGDCGQVTILHLEKSVINVSWKFRDTSVMLAFLVEQIQLASRLRMTPSPRYDRTPAWNIWSVGRGGDRGKTCQSNRGYAIPVTFSYCHSLSQLHVWHVNTSAAHVYSSPSCWCSVGACQCSSPVANIRRRPPSHRRSAALPKASSFPKSKWLYDSHSENSL